MRIEFEINSVTVSSKDLQGNPVILSAVNSFLPNLKFQKRRIYRKKKRVADVIDEIREDVEGKKL